MDFHLLKSVVDELSAVLPGARAERVYQGADGFIYFILRSNRKNYTLLLSPERGMPRIHLVSARPPAANSPSGFVQYLRSHLQGAKVAGIGLLNEDRVVELCFVKPDAAYCLVSEIFGSSANLILTDASYKILAACYLTPLGENVKRPFLPGLRYSTPEKNPFHPAKTGGNFSVEDVPKQTAGEEAPANRLAEDFFGRRTHERQIMDLRSGLLSALKKAIRKTEHRIAAVSGDLDSAESADDYRQHGDLILANLAQIKKGSAVAELTGYDGKKVTVRLDPKLSPGENAERCFKKYKKAKASLGRVKERLAQARAEASYLRSELSDVNLAGDQDELLGIRAELTRKGYLESRTRSTAEKKPEKARPPFREYIHSGWKILVGKSAAGNEYLSMKLARPDDLWLHAEGMPGSHVLVRNPEGRKIPSEVLAKAASLAAYYSKGRNAGKVPVTYTYAKFVKKPKGARPGAVSLLERKTVMAVPEGS